MAIAVNGDPNKERHRHQLPSDRFFFFLGEKKSLGEISDLLDPRKGRGGCWRLSSGQ